MEDILSYSKAFSHIGGTDIEIPHESNSDTLHKCFLIFNPFLSCKYKKHPVYPPKHTVPFLKTKWIEQIPFPISVRQNLTANNVEKTVIKRVTLHRLSVIMP